MLPVIFFLLILVWFFYWVITAVYVFSSGEIEKSTGTPTAGVKWNDTTRYVWLYNLFGLLWVNAFIIGCAQFILATGVATWYFSH